MKIPYSFCVLRYVHDTVTEEFINIGVAVYAPAEGFLRARCDTRYARITRTFAKIDGEPFRQLIRFIEGRINALADRQPHPLFAPPATIEQLLAEVLPPDDSGLQFSPVSVGISQDLDRTLEQLFERYVNRYVDRTDGARRDDDEVWRGKFREALLHRDVAAQLAPKKIVAPDYEYEFKHAWKNGVWNLYEPVSFDLLHAGSIVEKANQWLGRGTSLRESSVDFRVHLLLGEPSDSGLQNAFVKAENILRRMPGRPELIRERDADAFAEEFAKEVHEHERSKQ